ncbi:Uncharacterized protein Adt_37118 [Abeliophyllum distichum]|uniref:Uncharacterized protein n=1 Tax=Abeliophyllum distichum TaxID=126358 RepID=A0ABD1QJJ2_9LAMI
MLMRSSRRHVFEDIEIKDDRIEVKGQVIEGEEEAARVSICLPPKNALLLMRCRSDPMKMATLANRFSWDANAASKNEEEDDEDEYEDVEEQVDVHQFQVKEEVFTVKEPNIDEVPEQNVCVSVDFDDEQESSLGQEIHDLAMDMADSEEGNQEEEVQISRKEVVKEETEYEAEALVEEEEGGGGEKEHVKASPIFHSSPSTESDKEETASSEEIALFEEAQDIIIFEDIEENAEIKLEPEDEQKTVTAIPIESKTNEPENQEKSITASEKDKENQGLPECLLLMMCEPKLSMEVSKETWVCKTDFIRWLPERPLKKPTNGACDHEPIKKRLTTDSKPKPIAPLEAEKNSEDIPQPRRSSCTLPATSAASMATMIEQKLVNAVSSYEPLVLTRCKSEPMKTAAAKLMPESCFWKNAVGKIEPHSRATVGVGAAGVEF